MGYTGSFDLFGTGHFFVLGLLLFFSISLFVWRERLSGRWDKYFRWGLAGGLIVAGASGWAYATALGYLVIPLNLCDVALTAGVIGLLTLHQGACHLVYFWGLAGSLQAVLTPDLNLGFPSFRCVQFFASHAGVVLTAVYLAATGRIRPTWSTVTRIWLITNVYIAMVGLVNWIYGTNFGYLAEKPAHPSLLDFFGPWPYYIASIELVGTLLLLALYFPFRRLTPQ